MEEPVDAEAMNEALFGGSDDDSDDLLEELQAATESDKKEPNGAAPPPGDQDDKELDIDVDDADAGPVIDDLSDDEENGQAPGESDAQANFKDLFGSDEEEEGEDEVPPATDAKEEEETSQRFQEDEDAEESYRRRAAPRAEARSVEDQHIENTRLPRPPPGAKMFYVKLPNILGLDPRPFDRDTFEAADEDELVEGPEGQKMKPLPPETIMRWRTVTDKYGNPRRESNARFVRWSNGTVQLFLGGNEEVLDVDMQNITRDNYHVYAKQKGSIKAHGRLDSKLFFTPSTLHSKSHQKLTMHLVKQSQQKARKVKLVQISAIDPEKEKRSKESLEQERIKQNQRRKEMRQSYGLSSQMLEEGEGGDGEQYSDEDDDVEKRILEAKHQASSPVRKRSRDPASKRRSTGGGSGSGGASKGGRRTSSSSSSSRHGDDFINDDESDNSDVNVEDDWEHGGSDGGGSGSDDDRRKRRRSSSGGSSSSSTRRSSGYRSDSD